MDFSINTILSKLRDGGARPTLFSVQIINPFDANLGIVSPFMVKAASMPAATIGEIPIGYMGRKIKAAGDRAFVDWSCTVINDEDFAVKKSIERWINAIQGASSNIRNSGADTSFNYKAQAVVTQYSKAGTGAGDSVTIAEYTMYGLFPKEVGAVELSWDTENTIENFTVTFAYDYFTQTA